MQCQTDNLVRDGVVESFWTEFVSYWRRLPNPGLFLSLVIAWLLLFQFFGNSTLGYIDSPSLFHWMWNAYNSKSEAVDDTHGNLVPLVVFGLMWWKRKELFAAELRSWWPALVVLMVAAAFHVVGFVVQQPRVSIAGLFIGLYGIMGLAWGPQWMWRVFFPYALFVFAVPLGEYGQMVTFPLRLLVSGIVEFLGRNVLNLDLVREGTQFTNAAHDYAFDVAAACSGIRSLMTIFFICTAMGYGLFRWSWRSWVLLLSAFPFAVLGNALRLLVVVYISATRGPEDGKWAHDSAVISMLSYVPMVVGLAFLIGKLERLGASSAPSEARP